MKRITFLTVSAIVIVFAINSCKKDDNKWDADRQALIFNSIIERTYSDMSNISNQAKDGSLPVYGMDQVTVRYESASSVYMMDKSNCNVVITIDTVGSVNTLIVDWGSTNCTCNDGNKRRGKIITTWTGSYYAQGSIIKHVPVDYYVNDIKVEGVMTVENMGNNSNGQPYYNVNVDGTATFTSGEIVNYTSDRVRTFTNGYNTQLNFLDDEYDITGTADAEIVGVQKYTAVITSPLHVKVLCPYITKGTFDYTPEGQSTRTVDYGTGACDSQFTVTVDGHTYTINY